MEYMGKLGTLVMIVYILFGLYFLNAGLSFFTMPQFILNFQNIINLAAGGLLILGGYFFNKYNREY
jgi:hypothetical protein